MGRKELTMTEQPIALDWAAINDEIVEHLQVLISP